MFRNTRDPSSGSSIQGLANTDYVHVNEHNRTITVILAKHCIKLPDDGSLVFRNILEQFLNIFKYFIIILIVSTNYILVHLLDNTVF